MVSLETKLQMSCKINGKANRDRYHWIKEYMDAKRPLEHGLPRSSSLFYAFPSEEHYDNNN